MASPSVPPRAAARPLVFRLAAAVAVVLAAGCGGSSSESPWPVEPEHRELGPTAETAAPGTPLEERTPESRGEVSAQQSPRRGADEPDAGARRPAKP